MSHRAAIVIPARFASTRFPGKPLVKETGKFLIQHVVEQARKVPLAKDVIVATDDARILDAVQSFGGLAVMTSDRHESGTDRIAEVMRMPAFADTEIVVNVQGDEPEIEPALVNELIAVLEREKDADMATAATYFSHVTDISNPNMVKVVMDQRSFALYFSRAAIPFDRDGKNFADAAYRKHLGLYAYRRSALMRLADTPPCEIERIEKLEQLRALHLGMKIHVTISEHAPHGIDTPADYAAFVRRFQEARKT